MSHLKNKLELYLFYSGVSYRHILLFDDKGVEKNRKSFYAHGNDKMSSWTDFFNKCYFPIEKTTDIVDIIGYSDISIQSKKLY